MQVSTVTESKIHRLFVDDITGISFRYDAYTYTDGETRITIYGKQSIKNQLIISRIMRDLYKESREVGVNYGYY